MTQETLSAAGIVEKVIGHIQNKKGEDIVVLDLRKVTSIADYFVIATGNSNVHVKAIADEVRERLKRDDRVLPWHVEGEEGQKWILVDFVDVVVHVFDRETRKYYDIEKLYEDAESRKIASDF